MAKNRLGLSGLSPEKRALLHYLLEEEGITAAQTPALTEIERPAELPLSFAQQRLWLLDQLAPGNPAYNIPLVVRMSGALDVAALAHSLNAIVARHEALRTTFAAINGRPIQVIAPALELDVPLIDLHSEGTRLTEAEREAEVQRRATEQALYRFDLARGPLLQAAVLQLDQQEYVLLLVLHHIIADGWSTGVLIRELAALYAASISGADPALGPVGTPLPIQYADFAIWQRQWLQGKVLDQQLGYWKRQLADLPVLELPADRPRPAVQSYRGARQTFELSQEQTGALKALSEREGVTLFMTLLAAFQTMLYRYTGQHDLAVGSPVANRTRAEVEPLIGFFVNMLVLRTDLAGNPSFRELLQRVREVALDAYAHQDLPFEKLVEELQAERDLSHTPLFQVAFVLQNAPIPVLELPGLLLRPQQVDSGTAKFDLLLFAWEAADRLYGAFEYNSDLFDSATIARMVGHWQTVLAGILAQPTARLDDLPLLPDAERVHLLSLGQARAAFPQTACLHQRFAAQAARTPDAIALSYAGHALTYAQLAARAHQLAHHLQQRGVGPDVPVALCLDRSLDLVVAVLAILSAGGYYVPLDPAAPAERLR
ncbi:MAG TPA: condensation domain-containing protein, partial [Herpetosiphonaceae bacterium]